MATDYFEEGGEGQGRIAALEARISEAQRVIEGVLAKVGEMDSSVGALNGKADEVRTNAAAVIQSASSKLADIVSMRTRAEVALGQIEEDNRKANSEAGYAFNAKGQAEDHAKTIAQIKGTVEATFSGLTATKTNIEEVALTVAKVRASADVDAGAVVEAKATAVRDAATTAAAAERVAAVMPSIDQGSKDANAITAAKAGAEAAAAAIQLLQTQMNETTAKAGSDAASIAKADEDSKRLVSSMSDADTKANEVNTRLNTYEREIKLLGEAFEAMHEKIEGLLPHATSAGLASAFHSQKARFSKPQPWWLGLFVAAIVCLLLAASYGLPTSTDTWDAILRHFVNRLPLVAPLVWLAIYAGHHYNMALKMEEDYAFKEAVSTAFEGYKREMSSIPVTGDGASNPLVTLCENVLRSLAERPGRIYEGKAGVVTPLTPAAEAIKDIVAQAVKAKDTKPTPP